VTDGSEVSALIQREMLKARGDAGLRAELFISLMAGALIDCLSAGTSDKPLHEQCVAVGA
jgi:hypothetical protein